MDFTVVWSNLPVLLDAAVMTVTLSSVGMLFGLVLGAAVCALRLSPLPVLADLGSLYVSFFRGVPLLVQLLVIFYLLPRIGIDLPPWAAAIAALALCSGAYIAEILRGGLSAVPRGQAEAAKVLGLAGWDTWLRILLPQALRISLPSLINELILLLKASSLISVVGIAELTRASQNIAASSFRPLEIYLAAAVFYLAMNLVLSTAGGWVERRLAES